MAEMTETKAEMTDMKVTNEKGADFYIRAATNFLQGMEAKPAIEGKEAIEAKAALETLTISGSGEAINVAVAVAAKLEADSIAKIMETSYQSLSQITIKVKRLKGAAPFLHKVRALESEFVGKLLVDMIARDPSRPMGPDAMKAATLGKRKEWYENIAKPLMEKSFKFHDKDGSGVLDKEESAVFFDHLMEECCLMLRESLDKMVDPIFASVWSHSGVTVEVQKFILPKIATPTVNMMTKEFLAVASRQYFKQKAERDAAAFKVIDTKGDGKVQLSEFLAAMSPANEGKFMKALGWDDEEIAREVMDKIVPRLMALVQREMLNY